MAFTDPIDTGTPLGSESLSQGDERIREVKSGIQELLGIDHETTLTGTQINSTDSGCHNKATLLEQVSDPSAPTGVTTDFGIIYTKLDSDTTQAELFWKDENDNILQITKGNTIDLDLNYLSNDTWLEGTDFATTGIVNMIKVDTNDQVVIGHTSTKPAKLATTDPPLADADIANKKYVDDSTGAAYQATAKTDTGKYTQNVWSDVDDMTITETFTSKALLIMWQGTFRSDNNIKQWFAINVDGTRVQVNGYYDGVNTSQPKIMNIHWLIPAGLSGSKTIKIQIKPEGANTQFLSATDDSARTLSVMELK